MRDLSFGARTTAFAILGALVAWFAFGAPAGATGTVMIRQSDGHTDVYHDVSIKIIHQALFLTSEDGKGTLVINRAACAFQGQILVCFATGATLVQAGSSKPLDFKRGTVYLNLTGESQQLALSSQKVPARSILLSFTTMRGTYISLNGRIDKVVK